MSAHRLRAATAASALAVLALGFGATAAHAVGATITLPSEVVDTSEAFKVTGSCTTGSRSAVVTVTQDGNDVTSKAADLAGDLSYTATLDISDLEDGDARAVVACFTYPDRDPVATAAASFFAFSGATPYEVDVTASPSSVAIGGTITVKGSCAAGTTEGTVLVGNEDADEPFGDQGFEPAADGSFSATLPIARDTDLEDAATPKTGRALAYVLCGSFDLAGDLEGHLGDDFGIGFDTFTITAAPASAIPSTPAAPAGNGGNDPDAAGGLANTGSQTAPLTATAGVLLLGGLGLHRLRRRVSAV